MDRLEQSRKVDVRLPGTRNSNSHGARPVHLIITMIKWIRIIRLPIKNSFTLGGGQVRAVAGKLGRFQKKQFQKSRILYQGVRDL